LCRPAFSKRQAKKKNQKRARVFFCCRIEARSNEPNKQTGFYFFFSSRHLQIPVERVTLKTLYSTGLSRGHAAIAMSSVELSRARLSFTRLLMLWTPLNRDLCGLIANCSIHDKVTGCVESAVVFLLHDESLRRHCARVLDIDVKQRGYILSRHSLVLGNSWSDDPRLRTSVSGWLAQLGSPRNQYGVDPVTRKVTLIPSIYSNEQPPAKGNVHGIVLSRSDLQDAIFISQTLTTTLEPP
jgi:hypothetical protein